MRRNIASERVGGVSITAMQRSTRQASGIGIAEVASVSRLEFLCGPVRDGHVHAVLLEIVFEPVTVIHQNPASCPAMGCAVVFSMGLGQVSDSLRIFLVLPLGSGPAI